MYLAGANMEPIEEGLVQYKEDAYIYRKGEGYLWSHGIRVCRVGAYRKNESDTQMYVINQGIEIPAVFLNYSYKLCKEELAKYQCRVVIRKDRKDINVYQPYIEWLTKRIKYFQVVATLEGKPLK